MKQNKRSYNKSKYHIFQIEVLSYRHHKTNYLNANDDKKNKEFGYNMVILFVKSDKNIN